MTRTYLINLARSADRRSHMVRQFAKASMPYEIIEAVDGRLLDLSEPQFSYAAYDSNLTAGAFGCALSHFKTYQKILNDGRDFALILEDDVLLPTDLKELVDAVQRHMSGAEVVLLCFQSREALLTMAGAAQLPAGRSLVQVVDRGTPRSTAAYLITREACERMLKVMQPPVRTVADDWGTFYREGAIDRIRCIVPMPVHISPHIRTTMDNFRPGSLAERLLVAVDKLKVPVAYQILARRRMRFLIRLHGRLDFVPAESDNHLSLMKRDG